MVSAVLLTLLLSVSQEFMIPEGTILPVTVNETISTATIQEDEPVLLSLTEDVRSGNQRGPILIPRGSSVIGHVTTSRRAGRLAGRSYMNIQIQKIVTPDGHIYDGLAAKIVNIGKGNKEKGKVSSSGDIEGPAHRLRDGFLLLFPPTTMFQLLATLKRGPDIVFPVETRLYIKLMSPIYVSTANTARRNAPVESAPWF